MANCLKTRMLYNLTQGCSLPINGISEMYLIEYGAFTGTTDAMGLVLQSIDIPGTAKVVARVEGFGNSIKATETIKTGDYATGVAQSVTFPIQGNTHHQQQQAILNGRFVAFTRNEALQYKVYGLMNGLEASSFEASTDTNGNSPTVTLSTPENAGMEMPMSVAPSVWTALTARLFT